MIVECASELLSNLDFFSQCSQDEPTLVGFAEKLQTLPRTGAAAEATCKLAMLLAASRYDRDFDHTALEAVDQWVSTTSGEAHEFAIGFKAQARWSLGELDEAVKTAELLVSLLKAPRAKANARLDLAYYKAERFFTACAADEAEAVLIQKLLKKVPKSPDMRKQMSVEDTKGAVMIMTATTVHQVTAGLRCCEKAWAWAQANPDYTELFSGFYDLHAERAKRQLKVLTEA